MEKMVYDPDFNRAWLAYRAPRNASKIEAAKAWDKLRKGKLLPAEPAMIGAIEAYNSWLADVSGRQGKEYPKLHFATFLNQRRFEGWFPEEPVQSLIQAAPEPSSSSWPQGIQDKFAATGLSQAEWQAWMAPSNFIAGPPPSIICPSKLFVSMIEARYRRIIDRVISPETRVSVSL